MTDTSRRGSPASDGEPAASSFAGIDAGLHAHHVALVDGAGAILSDGLPRTGLTVEGIVALLTALDPPPMAIAIDAPCVLAPDGLRSRPAERHLQREVGCRIFPTPDAAGLAGHWWEAFLREGFRLHDAVRGATNAPVLEVFPTASRTVWSGARPASQPKGAWSDRVLRERAARLGVGASLPVRWNQHQRDAITAAWTARDHHLGATVELGGGTIPGIWVPAAGAHVQHDGHKST